MKKVLRKLIPSIIMMLIAAAFVGTSTFAWFSMNRTVTVTGMSVDTRVDDNLKIAATNAADQYDVTLTQSRTGHLRPVSTVDGLSFFYTGAANVNDNTGAAKTASYTAYTEATALTNAAAGKTNYDAAFQTAYGIDDTITTSNVAYGYIDYEFYLRATNVSDSQEALKLTNLELKYNGGNVAEKAWRVAVLAHEATAYTAYTTAYVANDLVTILALDSAANQTAGKAVDTASSVNTVTYGTAATIANVGGGLTKYYKVTVRLWLEGEDTTCKNDTFASLTQSYTLGLQFHIGGNETAVTAISTPAAQQQQNP